nr:hypothetical protein [Nitrospirota bacterium]
MRALLFFMGVLLVVGMNTAVVSAEDWVIHTGNVTKLDKATGAMEIENVQGKKESISVTDPDILKNRVFKKDLNVGDGVDVKMIGTKVVTVLRRNLPVTIRSK